jgi:hypothetical protein
MRAFAVVLTLVVASAAPLAPARLRAQATPPVPPQTLDALLAAAADYLDAYAKKFSAVVAEEEYTQTMKGPTGTVLLSAQPSHRELRSDVMMLNLGDSDWTQFRDVYEVDKTAVRDHETRLQRLFESPSAGTMSQAQRLADESASYNLGVTRNINVPTMALTYLSRGHQARSKFELAGSDTIEGERAQIVKFRETAVPALITSPYGPVAASGRFWIVPGSGDVMRSELTVVQTSPGRLTGTTSVVYGVAPAVGLRVPMQMDEEYQRGGSVDRGHATYSNFRAFTVDTKTLKRSGGGGGGGR